MTNHQILERTIFCSQTPVIGPFLPSVPEAARPPASEPVKGQWWIEMLTHLSFDVLKFEILLSHLPFIIPLFSITFC